MPIPKKKLPKKLTPAQYLKQRGLIDAHNRGDFDNITPNQAREILHSKMVNGKPLTPDQYRLFGFLSKGNTLKYQNGGVIPYFLNSELTGVRTLNNNVEKNVQLNNSLAAVFANRGKLPKAQTGGSTFTKDPNIKGPIGFLNSYTSGSEFKKRFKGQDGEYEDSQKLFNTAANKYKPFVINDNIPSEFDYNRQGDPINNIKEGIPADATVILSPNEANEFGTDLNNTILPHEYTHNIRQLNFTDESSFVKSNKDKSVNKSFNRWKNDSEKGLSSGTSFSKWYLDGDETGNRHDNSPDENYADLNALRYLMYKQGIYDTRKGPMTIEDLKKVQKDQFINDQHSTKRLFKTFSPEQIVRLNNQVAQNEIPDIPIAQMGGFSNTGYLNDSPDRFRPYNLIPSNLITMDNVDRDIMAYPDNGQPKLMKKNSGLHKFKGAKSVLEIPMAQMGTIFTNDKNDPRLQSYNDSLQVYNAQLPIIQSNKGYLNSPDTRIVPWSQRSGNLETEGGNNIPKYFNKDAYSRVKPESVVQAKYHSIGDKQVNPDYMDWVSLYKKPVQPVVYNPEIQGRQLQNSVSSIEPIDPVNRLQRRPTNFQFNISNQDGNTDSVYFNNLQDYNNALYGENYDANMKTNRPYGFMNNTEQNGKYSANFKFKPFFKNGGIPKAQRGMNFVPKYNMPSAYMFDHNHPDYPITSGDSVQYKKMFFNTIKNPKTPDSQLFWNTAMRNYQVRNENTYEVNEANYMRDAINAAAVEDAQTQMNGGKSTYDPKKNYYKNGGIPKAQVGRENSWLNNMDDLLGTNSKIPSNYVSKPDLPFIDGVSNYNNKMSNGYDNQVANNFLRDNNPERFRKQGQQAVKKQSPPSIFDQINPAAFMQFGLDAIGSMTIPNPNDRAYQTTLGGSDSQYGTYQGEDRGRYDPNTGEFIGNKTPVQFGATPFNTYNLPKASIGMAFGDNMERTSLLLPPISISDDRSNNTPNNNQPNNESNNSGPGVDYSTKGGDISTRTNNPGNIKFTPWLKKFGAVDSGIKATDGQTFAKFPSLETGLKAYQEQLFGTVDGVMKSSFYKPNTSVDDALKTWSNNGYGVEIYPELKGKTLAEVTGPERLELSKRQIKRESANMYNILQNEGIFEKPTPLFSVSGQAGLNNASNWAINFGNSLQNMVGYPLNVNSIFRSKEHNIEVGGVSNSQHLKGNALDVSPSYWNKLTGDQRNRLLASFKGKFINEGDHIHIQKTYQEGGEYEMDDNEIAEFMRNGGQIEYV